jgi:hypothetical protein
MGRSDDLQGFIYDVVTSRGGVAYTRTTKEIARHVGEKHTTIGSYLRTAIMTLSVPAPSRPTAPIGEGTPPVVEAVEQEIFKEKIRLYVKTDVAIETTMKLLYDLIWGQCTELLHSRLQGNDNFTTYSTTADTITLLKSIQAEMTGFPNSQYLPHELHKIMHDFYSISQGKHSSNQEYYGEFNSLMATAEESRATIGTHPRAVSKAISKVSVDPNNPTENKTNKALKTATERYLAVAFLLFADRLRYGLLMEEIENEYLQNRDDATKIGTYSRTVTEAYDYLCNYKKDPRDLARLLGLRPRWR